MEELQLLAGKHIALYVTGGIAAYKAASLVRELIRRGAEVRVAETEGATAFVTPLTFQVLSKHVVYTDRFKQEDAAEVAHIALADWTDIAIIAPATADVIGKLANGIADDFVTTALLATVAPKYIAPAMNVHMLANSAVARNLAQLQQDGFDVIDPAVGFLAEGYSGKGRLPEPHEIADYVAHKSNPQQLPLQGKKVIITAGGTRERLDPVRFIGNDSSGKMGYALAEAARDLGAEVILISAKTNLSAPTGIMLISVETAAQMSQAVQAQFKTAAIVIMAAAVSDYRPKQVAKEKIKKTAVTLTLELEKTPDILATLGQNKQQQYLIGFAAETQNIAEYAQGKLTAKKANMIVANDVSNRNAGFNVSTNKVTIFRPNQGPLDLPLADKHVIAREILAQAVEDLKLN